MESQLIWTAVFVLAAIALCSPRMLSLYRGFDAKNRERRLAEQSDRADHLAHFRHTLRLAEEQVEAVSSVVVADERTGTPVTRYLFEGETFADEEDAKTARADKMRAIAKGFYMDLPAALRSRKEEDRLRGN